MPQASEIDEMIKQSANPDRYKADPKYPAALKEVYAKIQSFLPDKTSVLVESCQGLLNNLVRYRVFPLVDNGFEKISKRS